MKIEKLNITFAERYESFLLVHQEALIYHSWRYQNFLVELLDCCQETRLVVDREGQILAALPLMSMNDCKYGRVFNSMPYYGSHGSIIGNNAEAVRMLQNEFRDLHRDNKVAASTVIENPLSKNDNNNFDYDLYVERIGQFTRIENLKSADLMEIFHSKTRNMIRKACKLGITCEVDNKNFTFLGRVHHENMLEVGGLSKTLRSFELIKKHFIEESDYRLYIAKHQGSEVAGLLVFYYNSVVEYYTQ
ncbi:hypothetical protein [Polynucleobacter difficilis]|uniref:hypothetical protein n=1 Tax=Polynucleobacter difficilis TaxID=556054 RepID=UPI000D3451D3|nr:hypothetical protein [Polynucleobacter difficilis]